MDPIYLMLLALAGAVYLATAIINRPVALALFCGLLPTYLLRFSVPIPGLSGGLPSTFLEVMFGILFLTWLVLNKKENDVYNLTKPWHLPLVLLFVGATIGALIAPDLRGALGVWRAYFVEPILFFFMFVDIVDRPSRRHNILLALSVSLAVIGFTAVYQKITGFGIPNPYWQAEATRRATSFFGYPNGISLLSAPLVVLAAAHGIALLSRRKLRDAAFGALAISAAFIGALGVTFAVSEGGIIALAGGLVVLGLLVKGLRYLTLGVVAAACIAILSSAPLLNYFTDIASFRDDSSSVRMIVWSESFAMLSDHQIFGAGLSAYPDVLPPYHLAEHIEIFQYPHTIVMNFWSETGVIGVVGFFWLVGVFLYQAFTLHRHEGEWLDYALVAVMATMLIHGLVDVPYFKNDLAFLFMIVIGLLAGLRHPRRST